MQVEQGISSIFWEFILSFLIIFQSSAAAPLQYSTSKNHEKWQNFNNNYFDQKSMLEMDRTQVEQFF